MLTDEQRELRSAVTRSLERSTGPRPYLAGESATEETWDAGLWRVLAREVGVAGLLVPEDLGGAGAGVAELAVVAEALGSALAAVPFLGTVALATPVLLEHRDDPVARELLRAIADGRITATLAWCRDLGSWDIDSAGETDTLARCDGEQWQLTGEARFVVDATAADVLLVPARTEDGIGLFAVNGGTAGADGLHRTQAASLDLTRPFGTIALDGTPARIVGSPSGAEGRIRAALDLTLVILAAEQVGCMQHCLDGAVEYAKQRVQFDRPIGSFQAIKHQLVDVLLKVEMARSTLEAAVVVADTYLAEPTAENAHLLTAAASVAKATCAEAFMHTAEETLHVYGGTGFTWEHDAHLYYRRAKTGELLLGTPTHHHERLAAAVGL